jgi:hypothetical protein
MSRSSASRAWMIAMSSGLSSYHDHDNMLPNNHVDVPAAARRNLTRDAWVGDSDSIAIDIIHMGQEPMGFIKQLTVCTAEY